MGKGKTIKKEKKIGRNGNEHFSLEILQAFLMTIPFQKEVNLFQRRALNKYKLPFIRNHQKEPLLTV